MRKLSALLLAGALTAVASVSAITAGAAGINSAEQAVLDELHTSVTMKGTELVISDEYINQAQNYFNTIEMTDDESQEIIGIIKEGKTFLETSGASNILDLSYEQKEELLTYGEEVVGVIDMTMSFDKTTKELTIFDSEGNVAFKAIPTLQTKTKATETPTGATQTATTATSKSSTTTQGNTTTQGKVAASDVIKTTGTNVNTAAVAGIAGAAVLMATAGAAYAVKTKKERA